MIGLTTVIGAVLLWPHGKAVDIPLPFQNAHGGAVSTEAGHVVSTGMNNCGSPSVGAVLTSTPVTAPPGAGSCVQSVIGIDSGPNSGANTLLEFSTGPGQPASGRG